MFERQTKLYIADANGVIIDEILPTEDYAKINAGDRVLKRGSIEYLKDTISIKYHFIKVNPIAYSKISVKYPIINCLIQYVGYMDGILSYRNGKFIRLKDIPKVCNVSESTAKRQIKGLMKEDVIHKVKDNKQTYLVINPWVVYIGKRVYKSLYDEFRMSKWHEECEVS